MFRKIVRSVRKRLLRAEVCGQQPAASGNEAAPSSDRQDDIAILRNSHKLSGSGAAEAFSVVLEVHERGAALDEAHSQRCPTHCLGDYSTKSACPVNDYNTHSDVTALTAIEDMSISDCLDYFPIDSEPIVDSLTLGAMWNTFAWINKLPDEVLVEILLSVPLRSWRDWGLRIMNPVHYMRVCRHWRRVILGHGCFWSTIVVDKHGAWLPIALSRSREAQLNMTFRNLPTLRRLLPHVIPVRDRVRSLVLGPDSKDEVTPLSPLLGSVFPSLTKLVIDTYGGWRNHPVDNPFVFLPTNYPKLTHLELANILVQFTTPLLSHLTTLHLKDCSIWPTRISADQFLDTLRCGQHLKSLTLTNFMAATCSTSPSPSKHSFSLPELTELNITDAADWVHHMTTFVQLPARGEVHLKATISDLAAAPPDFWALLLPQRLRDMPFARTDGRFMIVNSAYGCTLNWRTGGACVSLELRSHDRTTVPTTAILAALTEALRPSRGDALILNVNLHDVPRTVIDNFFDAFPRLRRLCVVSPVVGNEDPIPLQLLESMAGITPDLGEADTTEAEMHAQVEADGRPEHHRVSIRCPELRRMNLGGFSWDGGEIMRRVVECLRERARLGAPNLVDLRVHVKPRASGEERKDKRYATQLRDLVSDEFTFKVGTSYSQIYF